MNSLWRLIVLILALAVFVTACSPQAAAAPATQPVLLFDIGMHIEPFGSTPSALVTRGNAPPRASNGDYNNAAFFQRHVQDINAVAAIAEKHGGRLTIQTQSPFTTMAVKSNNTILSDLAARGHEIGLHFHEDAHLGKTAEALPVETWCAVMKEEIGYIQQAGVTQPIRYWSGGNLYAGLLDAASCAGLSVNSDWKNPKTQQTDPQLIGINPWRPAGGATESDVSGFARNDPNGKIVFLPEGLYARGDFASMRRSDNVGGDAAYFEFLKTSFNQSLQAAQPDKVNVFHFTVHAGEFRGDPKQPFAVIDKFLAEVVDPAVRAGKVKWATFSEMADAYRAWEKSTVQLPIPNGYMTFAINVHDTVHVDESANTILRLVSLFEKYGVRGDFYLTAPTVELYAKQRPDVIARLRDSDMTISYHVRPPHPLYSGFDQRLKGLDDQALAATLRDYETYRLDPATGDLDKSLPGGYTYVAQTFGRKPVVASTQSGDPRNRQAALKLFAELGAKMTVLYHEEGTDLPRPLVQQQGLWVRPSDFSITRWGQSGSEPFWWNMLSTPKSAEYNPTEYLKQQLANWQATRAPFITSLIHENNFARSGPEGWTPFYYGGKDKTQPLAPPYNLTAPDPSRVRSQKEQDAIWNAYEELVAYAARNLRVVTSEDIVELAATVAAQALVGATPQLPVVGSAANTNWVTNPTTNARLYVQVFRPKTWDGKSKLPALVLVPGGIGDSGGMVNDAARFTEAGFAAVVFDPDGRGKSEGREDYDGYKHQDGLGAVIRFAATLPEVDAKQIGVVTFSYGITMGSGALARYPDLPVRFLVDWEGPADRNYTTTGCHGDSRIAWQPCSDNAWWSEREAVNFVGKLRVPYQRVQSEQDHVQPTNAHAVDMMNAAVKGGVPWTRLNDYPPNQMYDPNAPPQMLPDTMDRERHTLIVKYARALLQIK